MMIKGNNPENIRVGSTLSTDEFSGHYFDFMLSNPPYGKSWATDLKYIKDGKDIIDPRFIVTLKDYWGNAEEADATPRSSDGQLLFLMEMVNKMPPLLLMNEGGKRLVPVFRETFDTAAHFISAAWGGLQSRRFFGPLPCKLSG
jgi:type I restriction enzyme M protein